MSSTETASAPASPTRARVFIAVFGVAMFALGVAIGGLALPRVLNVTATPTPQLPAVAQVSLTATTVPTATVMPTVAPTTTQLPATATPPPPTATSTVAPTPTIRPTPTAEPTRPASSIFAPDPATTATTSGTAPTATATNRGGPTPAATITVASTPTPAPPATAPGSPFAATDRIDTQLPVNFRAGPGTTYAAQAALPPGTLLAATGETQTAEGFLWQQFRLANGTLGWVRAQDVAPVR